MTKLLTKIYRILLEEYGYRHKWYGDTPDEIVIGAILTQHTNWSNVEKSITNLKNSNLLSLNAIAQAQRGELAAVIRPSGYHNQKSARLISIAKSLTRDTLTDNPAKLRTYLLTLNGIGPETADCIMLYAYHYPYFVIDAYTIRIFSRLGLCPENIRYEKLQEWFMHWLEADVTMYSEYHALLIKLAKTACFKKPKCYLCPLRELCSYAINENSMDTT